MGIKRKKGNDMFKIHNILGFCLTLAVFFAGSADAKAELLNAATICEAIQTGGDAQDFRVCLPDDAQIFPEP